MMLRLTEKGCFSIGLTRRSAIGAMAAFLAAAGAVAPAAAQTFPGNMQMIIPFDAGGGTDRIGRLVAENLGKELGTTIRVINMPGANAGVSHRYVLEQPADGNTILFTTIGQIVIAPLVEESGYKPEDFTPIAQISNPVYALVVKGDAPWKTMQEFVAAAEAAPGTITLAGGSTASASGFQAVDLIHSTGANIVMVPTTGASDSTTMVLGGHVASTTRPLGSVVPLVQSGDLRALVVSGAERDPTLPDVPTALELGYQHEFGLWRGLVVDAETPPDVVAKLEAAVEKVLADPAYIEASSAIGEPPAFKGSEEFAKSIAAEVERFRPVMDAALGRN